VLDRGAQSFHIELSARLAGTPPRLDYLLLPLECAIEGPPDFTHVSSHKRFAGRRDRRPGCSSHLPRSYRKGGILAAIVPDLDLINQHVVYAAGPVRRRIPRFLPCRSIPSRCPCQTALDLNLQTGLTARPVIAYGVMDYVAQQHVFWHRVETKGAMVRQCQTIPSVAASISSWRRTPRRIEGTNESLRISGSAMATLTLADPAADHAVCRICQGVLPGGVSVPGYTVGASPGSSTDRSRTTRIGGLAAVDQSACRSAAYG